MPGPSYMYAITTKCLLFQGFLPSSTLTLLQSRTAPPSNSHSTCSCRTHTTWSSATSYSVSTLARSRLWAPLEPQKTRCSSFTGMEVRKCRNFPEHEQPVGASCRFTSFYMRCLLGDTVYRVLFVGLNYS